MILRLCRMPKGSGPFYIKVGASTTASAFRLPGLASSAAVSAPVMYQRQRAVIEKHLEHYRGSRPGL